MDLLIGTYERMEQVRKFGPPSKEEQKGEIVGGWLGGMVGVGIGTIILATTGPLGAVLLPSVVEGAVDAGRQIGISNAKKK